MGIKFPYLEKRMEDGTLYRYLTHEDIVFLLGERRDSTSYLGGIYKFTYELNHKIEIIYRGIYDEGSRWINREISDVISQYENQIDDNIRQFKSYLDQYKIHVEE